MTIYLFDNDTQNFIGQVNSPSGKSNIDIGTLIIFQHQKYIVVLSEKVNDTTFNVAVNKI